MTNINDTYALTTFKNGLNEEHKFTVFAAQPKTLNAATNIAPKVEKCTVTNTNKMHKKKRYNTRTQPH